MSKFEECKAEFGSVYVDGVEYAITHLPYIDGTNDVPYYTSWGITADNTDEEIKLCWDVFAKDVIADDFENYED